MKWLLVLAASLLPAPVAHGQPQALGRTDALTVGGGAAITARTGARTVTVTRRPFDGSASTVLFTTAVPANRRAAVELSASDQRVGMILTLSARKSGSLKRTQVLTGPSAGPLAPAGAPTDLTKGTMTGPSSVSAAGEAVIVEDGADHRTAIAPDGSQAPVDLPAGVTDTTFAGDLVAYSVRTPQESEEDPPTKLVVANWRAGDVLHRLTLPRGLIHLDFEADGHGVLELDGGPLQALAPDGTLTALKADASTPVIAGDDVVALRHDDQGEYDRLVVFHGDGATRHGIGLNARAIEDVSADAGHVVWRSNGCAFSAALDDGPSLSFANAGCAASESYVVTEVEPPALARTLEIPIGCLNAADGTCQGTLRGEEFPAVEYTVRAGQSRRVTIRLRAKAYRKLQRRRYRVVHLTDPPGFPFLLRDGPRRHG